MEKFLWSDQYSVGNDEIDLQHQRLFTIFNTLAEGIESGEQSKKELEHIFRQLYGYVKNHFRFEEALMKSVNYPDLKEHRKIHEKVTENLKKYRAKFHRCTDDKKCSVAKDVAAFLQDWLQNHIKGEDQQYSPFLPIADRQKKVLTLSPELPSTVMQPFLWNERYSVGHQAIDEQHQRLFTIFNDLIQSISTGDSIFGVEKTFLKLRGYAKSHFRYEEALMRRNNYPDLASHKERHDKICTNLKRYRIRFNAAEDAEKQKIAHEVATYFNDWLQGHIKAIDKQYTPYVTES